MVSTITSSVTSIVKFSETTLQNKHRPKGFVLENKNEKKETPQVFKNEQELFTKRKLQLTMLHSQL